MNPAKNVLSKARLAVWTVISTLFLAGLLFSPPILATGNWFPGIQGFAGVLSLFWGLSWLPLFGAMLDGLGDLEGDDSFVLVSIVMAIQLLISLSCWGHVIYTLI